MCVCACVFVCECEYVCVYVCVCMEFPERYTESVNGSRAYGREKELVGDGPLYPDSCLYAKKIRDKMYDAGFCFLQYVMMTICSARICSCCNSMVTALPFPAFKKGKM